MKPIAGQQAPSRSEADAGPRKVYSRHSFGLEQFCTSLREQPGLSVLDLGEVNQENVSFLTSLGHRLYAEDFVRTMDGLLAGYGGAADPSPAAVEALFEQAMIYPPASFDAALLWDALEQLSPPLLARTIDRLLDILRPGAPLLAFFHAEDRPEQDGYSFRILDDRNLRLHWKGAQQPVQYFNNRNIERLFARFHSVKFFLARDHLREVIIIR